MLLKILLGLLRSYKIILVIRAKYIEEIVFIY
jgi:hypothetical protein